MGQIEGSQVQAKSEQFMKMNAKMRSQFERRIRLRSAGVCVDCGRGKAQAERVLCAECLKSRRERERRRIQVLPNDKKRGRKPSKFNVSSESPLHVDLLMSLAAQGSHKGRSRVARAHTHIDVGNSFQVAGCPGD